jgi:predicted Zn finger-like uncharacterized protein
MRLICPSCRAQYEVDDDAIPVEGRDVQCGSCSTTWFQEHALTLTGALAAPVAEAEPPVFRHSAKAPAAEDLPGPQHRPDDSSADREALLRQVREATAEAAETESSARIERQPATAAPRPQGDLPPPPAAAASKPEDDGFIQEIRKEIAAAGDSPEVFASTRASSVISAAGKAGIAIDAGKATPPAQPESVGRIVKDIAATPEPPPRRRSYSVGVYAAALLFLLALAVYLLRSEIAAYSPALAPWLEVYGNLVDDLRLAVQDGWVWARGLVAGASDAAPSS